MRAPAATATYAAGISLSCAMVSKGEDVEAALEGHRGNLFLDVNRSGQYVLTYVPLCQQSVLPSLLDGQHWELFFDDDGSGFCEVAGAASEQDIVWAEDMFSMAIYTSSAGARVCL